MFKQWILITLLALTIAFGIHINSWGNNELGNGSGSDYPYSIDHDTRPETSSDYAREDVPNDLADAINRIQVAIGTGPAGSYHDVKTRLDAIGIASATISSGYLTNSSATLNYLHVGSASITYTHLQLFFSSMGNVENSFLKLTSAAATYCTWLQFYSSLSAIENNFLSVTSAPATYASWFQFYSSMSSIENIFLKNSSGAATYTHLQLFYSSMSNIENNFVNITSAAATYTTWVQFYSSLSAVENLFAKILPADGASLGGESNRYKIYVSSIWYVGIPEGGGGGVSDVEFYKDLYPDTQGTSAATLFAYETIENYITTTSTISYPCINFLETGTTSWYEFSFRVNGDYDGGDIEIGIKYISTSATSGNSYWMYGEQETGHGEAWNDGTLTYGYFNAQTVPGTVSYASSHTVTITPGWTVSDMVKLRIGRYSTNASDTVAGNLQIIAVWVREP